MAQGVHIHFTQCSPYSESWAGLVCRLAEERGQPHLDLSLALCLFQKGAKER